MLIVLYIRTLPKALPIQNAINNDTDLKKGLQVQQIQIKPQVGGGTLTDWVDSNKELYFCQQNSPNIEVQATNFYAWKLQPCLTRLMKNEDYMAAKVEIFPLENSH